MHTLPWFVSHTKIINHAQVCANNKRTRTDIQQSSRVVYKHQACRCVNVIFFYFPGTSKNWVLCRNKARCVWESYCTSRQSHDIPKVPCSRDHTDYWRTADLWWLAVGDLFVSAASVSQNRQSARDTTAAQGQHPSIFTNHFLQDFTEN